MQIPEGMEIGSHGINATLVQVFLCGRGLGEKLAFDGEYGEMTSDAVKAFQKAEGLEEDGSFGSQTRQAAKSRYNFDFVAAFRSTRELSNSPLVSVFIVDGQPFVI